MLTQLRIATLILIAMTILTGVVYPLLVTVMGQIFFAKLANGSILLDGEARIGSELIGQSFSKPEYFWGRLSATSPVHYNAAASSGSNFGPMNQELKRSAKIRIAELAATGSTGDKIPIDLVTASGSGLDPHISPAAAEYQVSRIAKTRGLTVETVRTVVGQHTQRRQLGVLGEPRVHVLRLNLALDRVQNRE